MSLVRITLLFGALAFAQSTPEITTSDSPTTFSTRVNLVLVPVVVRDKQGHPLGTLQREDFQLFDKGKPQVITKFSVEKAGAGPTIRAEVAIDEKTSDQLAPAPPPIADRFVAYFFDDMHLNAGDLTVARNAAGKNLSASAEPATRFAIYTTSGQTTLDFTDDREKLHETLLRIYPRAGAAVPPANCPDISYYMADLIQNKNDMQAFDAATQEAMACLGLDPSMPGSVQTAQLTVRTTTSMALRTGENETQFSLSKLKDMVRRISLMPGSRTIVLVSPGFYLDIEHRGEETDIMDRAIRANVTIGALDARGLYTVAPGGDVSQGASLNPQFAHLKLQYQGVTASAETDIMAELAAATGGTFFHNNNDLAQGFRQVASRPEYVYVLGFSPQNLKLDGGYHPLKVTLKATKGVDLQARLGYYAPRHLSDPEEDAKREIEEAVFSREEMQDIPVDLHMQFFKSSDENARLTVLARVDVKRLHFRKAEGRNKDKLIIVSGLFDRNGNFIKGFQKTLDMNLKDQTLESIPASGLNLRTNFDITPGSYVIRLVVRDSEGQMMAARNGAVEIP